MTNPAPCTPPCPKAWLDSPLCCNWQWLKTGSGDVFMCLTCGATRHD